MTDWNSTLQGWVKPPSDSEEIRRDKTEAKIRAALDAYAPIPNASIRVFAQGSYKNNTNVRLLSDVDVAVELQEGESSPTATPSRATTNKIGSAKDLTDEELGLSDAGRYEPKAFKDHVELAMKDAFGDAVERGNKAIRIRQSSTTLKADVVPCVPHRRHDSSLDVHRGIRIFPDEGHAIVNYPQQHCDNGVDKNTATGRRYKRMVRAFKKMAFHLSSTEDEPVIPSFTIECMVYNVPNVMFGNGTYRDDFQAIAKFMWFRTYDADRCDEWKEVSELKYLFRGSSDDKRTEASDFAWKAWKLVEDA